MQKPSLPLVLVASLAAGIIISGPAEAEAVAAVGSTGRYGVVAGSTVVGHGSSVHYVIVDRGVPGWWHGRPGFVGYLGYRPGYWYAPGYGYYGIPRRFVATAWVVGAVLPPVMRSYVVVRPALYGLPPAPLGYGWYYAGNNIVLISIASGLIVQSVVGGW